MQACSGRTVWKGAILNMNVYPVKARPRTPPRISRPPAPVEVKKVGQFSFVQTLPLGYNQGEPSPTSNQEVRVGSEE